MRNMEIEKPENFIRHKDKIVNCQKGHKSYELIRLEAIMEFEKRWNRN